jgi:asparagine synthase (glutamine-hydrolysing)
MCGIAGTVGFGDEQILRAMTDAIAHRGPDGEGFFLGDGVALGSRRLAILDIDGGAQPMTNSDESVVVVYNGELYNYPELRAEVLGRGHHLRTTCDTELLPYLYQDEGIAFLRRLDGIFAFALLDRTTRTLVLVRDPLGVKPLVYAERQGRLAFGSEAKAVLASGLVRAEIDPASLHQAMNVRYLPGERTFFHGIRRLAPGHVMEIRDGGVRTWSYTTLDWSPDERTSRADWLDGIRYHYQRAVLRQLQSDVPVGVSLSGGIDSTSIVAMLRAGGCASIATFSLGFGEPTDELDDARFVARRYATDHHELVLQENALVHLRAAIRHAEEPKVNALQLYLLHRFIGEHVTVALSGLGGDELFGGYDIYRYLARTDVLRQGAPAAVVRRVGPALERLASAATGLGRPPLDLSVRKLEWLASAVDPPRHYLLLRNAWDANPALVRRVYTPDFTAQLAAASRDDFDALFDGDGPLTGQALRAEFATKLVGDLLHNEDTMSMAHGVESRVPLLDLELVRFAARIPDRLRFGSGPKGLLKEAFRGLLPERVLAKRKWGFTFDPVQQYGKDLRPLALEVLTDARLRETGVFNPTFVHDVLATRPRPSLRWHYFMLWQMIGVELWREEFERPRDRPGSAAPALDRGIMS